MNVGGELKVVWVELVPPVPINASEHEIGQYIRVRYTSGLATKPVEKTEELLVGDVSSSLGRCGCCCLDHEKDCVVLAIGHLEPA